MASGREGGADTKPHAPIGAETNKTLSSSSKDMENPCRAGSRIQFRTDPKADIVREVAWIYSYRSSQNADKGGRASQIPKILRTSFMQTEHNRGFPQPPN